MKKNAVQRCKFNGDNSVEINVSDKWFCSSKVISVLNQQKTSGKPSTDSPLPGSNLINISAQRELYVQISFSTVSSTCSKLFSNRMCRDSSEISYAPSAQEKWSKYNHRSFVLQNKFRGLWEIIKLALTAKIEYLRGTPESRYFQVPSHWNRTLGLKLEMTNGEPIKKKHCQVKQLYKFHHESNKTITIVQACLITFLSIHIMLFVAVSMDGYLVFPCKGL
jgi:hypothetical protein